MIRKIPLYLLLIFLAIIPKAKAQFQFDTYAIQGVHLIDVRNKQLVQNQTLVINKDRITGIYDSNTYSVPDSIQVLDYVGHFVVPGLIDAHVHVGSDPSSNDKFESTKEKLQFLLNNGVTTVRDMAGDARYLSYLARQAALDEIPAPDIYYSALVAGESFFKDPRTSAATKGMSAGNTPWMRAIRADSDLNQFMAEAKGAGATGIKIYADLDKTQVERIVLAAHSQGLKVWAHGTVFPARPSEVNQAGADVLSHASYLAWEGEKKIPADASNRKRKHENFNLENPVFSKLMKEMQRNQTILDATVSVFQEDSTLYQYGISLTQLAYQNQVKIGVGTDIYISDFFAPAPIFKELEALEKDVQMAPLDIIQAVTLINAEMLGKENEIGSIEIGKKANLLILSENPIDEIKHLQSRVLVIKNGKLFNPK